MTSLSQHSQIRTSDRTDKMASETGLKNAVLQAFKPWRESEERPPFTQEQLVVIALTLSGEPLTRKQMLHWQASMFPYYREAVFEYFWSQSQYGTRSGVASKMCMEQQSVLGSYELPVTQIPIEECDQLMYRINKPAAWTILQTFLPRSEEVFRFLDLPSELRIRIYEMIFKPPPSGLKVRCYPESGRRRLGMMVDTKDFSEPFSMAQHMQKPGDGFRVRKLSKYHHVLLINKQISKEAMPYFYSANTFFCANLWMLKQVLYCFGPSYGQFLRHLAIYYDHEIGQPNKYVDVSDTLASVPRLRLLHIGLSEARFAKEDQVNRYSGSQKQHRVEDIGDFNVPGINKLRQMRHRVKIIFEGACPNIAAEFEAETQAEKSKKAAAAEANDEDDQDLVLYKGRNQRQG